jgi:hypothetical protein
MKIRVNSQYNPSRFNLNHSKCYEIHSEKSIVNIIQVDEMRILVNSQSKQIVVHVL